jgi:uncharacterized protein (TIRG00374 family)
MTTEKLSSPVNHAARRYLPLLNLVLVVVLIAAGIWYLSFRVGLAAVAEVISGAEIGYLLLATAIMVLTIAIKGLRWQLMFNSSPTPIRYSTAFWATALGQYVNLIIPFLRLGEIARLYALNQETGAAPAQTLGTLVLEKTLELIFFGMTIVVIIPFVILPDAVGQSWQVLIALPIILLSTLLLLAYRTAWIIEVWRKLITPLPKRLGQWLEKVMVSGLEGLSSLRNKRLSMLLILLSLVIAVLSVLLSYVLFPALDLPLTMLDAALVHVVVTLAITPPSTPAKIGVFNGAAALLLWSLGLTDEAAIAGYAILLYLVVIVPQIILGLVAASRSKWRWQTGMLVLDRREKDQAL